MIRGNSMGSELENNCVALQAVGRSMRSLLGPTNSVKCCIEGFGTDQSQESRLLIEPLQIIEALTSSGGLRHGHPANQLLYESCQGQQNECGCGLTTLVCLSAFWSEKVLKLKDEGVPLPVVFTLFEECLDLCDPLFTSSAIPIQKLVTNHRSTQQTARPQTISYDQPSMSHDLLARLHDQSAPLRRSGSHMLAKVRAFSRHLSSDKQTTRAPDSEHCSPDHLKQLSRVLAHGRDEMMRMSAEALGMVWSERGWADISCILTHSVVGKGQSSSRVLRGVLLDVQSEMITLLENQRELRLVVIEGDCTPTSTHPGMSKSGHLKSHNLLYTQQNSTQWLKECSAVLEEYDIGLVVVGGAMSMLLWEHCLATQVVVVTEVHQEQREAISKLAEATPSRYLQHINQGHIGHDVYVELVEGGWSIPRVLYNGATQRRPIKTHMLHISMSNTSVVTAMLCGSTETTVNLMNQQFLNCLHHLNCALSDSHVLPGGGAFEAMCVHTLREAAAENKPHPFINTSWMFDNSLMSHWRPAVYRAVVDGLMSYIVTVLMNVDSRLDIYMAKCEGERMACEDVKVCRHGCERVSVYDDVRSKRAAWRRAMELVRTVIMSERILQ